MCEALEYVERLNKEYYDTSYWSVFCYGDEMYVEHGFIFPDGSVIDVTIGEDHRIISMSEWTELRLITFTATGDEADFRVHGSITYRQAKVLCDISRMEGIEKVYIDVYTEAPPNYYVKDMLKGTIELYPDECYANHIKDLVERLLVK